MFSVFTPRVSPTATVLFGKLRSKPHSGALCETFQPVVWDAALGVTGGSHGKHWECFKLGHAGSIYSWRRLGIFTTLGILRTFKTIKCWKYLKLGRTRNT